MDDLKQKLVDDLVERIVRDQADKDGNSKEIDGERRFHHLFVMGVERFRSQLVDMPLHALQDQMEAGSFAFFDN